MEKSIYGVYIQKVTLRHETISVEEILKRIGIELELNRGRLDREKEGDFIKECRRINNRFIAVVKNAQEAIARQIGSFADSPLRQAKLKDAGPADFANGGIDFTNKAMRIGLEPMGSFAGLKLVLPEISNVAAIDLDNEFKQIQIMATSGIRPSDNRILEFAAACYYRGEFGPRLGEITACLQQAHFLDERLGRESSEVLRLATMLPEVFYSYSLN